MVSLIIISKFLRKHKILTFLLFTFGVVLFLASKVFASSDTVVNSGYYGYSDWGQISFTYDSDWYTYLQNNCPYLNDSDYYRIIFNTSNASNRLIYKYALFIKKSDLATGVVPFTVNISNTNAPGNVTRQVVVNNVGGTIYEYGWYNGSPWSSSYINQGTGNWNIQYGQNTSNYELLYYVWSSYDSCIFNIAGNTEHYTFPDEIPPFVAPTIDLDTTSVAENGLNGFAIYGGSVSPSDSMTLKFYNGLNNTNSNDLIEAYTLNENSGWFVNIHETGQYAGQSYFYITNRFMNPPLNIVTGNSYTVELTYPGSSGTENIYKYWTFNLTSSVEQNIQDNTQQNIEHELQETNDYLTNDNINDDDIELPEIEVNDFTYSFFSTAVSSIVDAMNSATSNESITVEFRGTTYTINSSDFNFLRNNGFDALRNLLPIFWIFSIGLMIYTDAHHRIQKLKEFNWHAMFADDIQVDML